MNAPYRRLSRPRTDRMAAGVIAGLARYFGMDATALRVVYALIVLFSWGTALLAYPVAWLLMPEDPATPGHPATPGYPPTTGYPAPPAAPPAPGQPTGTPPAA